MRLLHDIKSMRLYNKPELVTMLFSALRNMGKADNSALDFKASTHARKRASERASEEGWGAERAVPFDMIVAGPCGSSSFDSIVRARSLARALPRAGGLFVRSQELLPYDQHHYDGTRALDECAKLIGLSDSQRLLNIGSGLGGCARYFAGTYGCEVLAVELQQVRAHAWRGALAPSRGSNCGGRAGEICAKENVGCCARCVYPSLAASLRF